MTDAEHRTMTVSIAASLFNLIIQVAARQSGIIGLPRKAEATLSRLTCNLTHPWREP